MTDSRQVLTASQAARRLGVSAKALRLYERHGLLKPLRNESGWRFYGEAEMARAAEIVILRRLGMSLAEAGQVLAGKVEGADALLANHQAGLERALREVSARLDAVRDLRAGSGRGQGGSFAWRDLLPPDGPAVALELPWPWGGERMEIARLPPVTWLTGPLGSGKTKLALALAEAIPGAAFSGLERVEMADAVRARLDADPALAERVEVELDWLRGDGATMSGALLSLVVLLCDPDLPTLVIDLVEEGLDEPTQDAVGAWLRRYDDRVRPLVVMTRSTAVLDLETVGVSGLVIYCPANHSPPLQVLPVPGAAGYDEVVSCLAPPEVRRRTAGMVAVMP